MRELKVRMKWLTSLGVVLLLVSSSLQYETEYGTNNYVEYQVGGGNL